MKTKTPQLPIELGALAALKIYALRLRIFLYAVLCSLVLLAVLGYLTS